MPRQSNCSEVEVNLSELESGTRERIIKGKNNWWFLGPGGVARLKDKHLTSEGTLRPAAERYLQEQGLFVVRRSCAYALTVLTSTDCNLGCGYCFQNTGQDLTGGNRPPRIAHSRLTSQTITSILEFTARQMAAVEFTKLHVLLFGGEPLLNLPVMYDLAERAWQMSSARGVSLFVNIITNGLLLTPEVVERMLPFGLNGIKITLDGDRETHNRMRPLRGGQGTFDRIVENVRAVAGTVRIAIGGNFDESSADSYPALLEYLKRQDFADKLSKIFFKPIVRVEPVSAKGIIPLRPVAAKDALNGTCMTSLGSGAGKACDTCNVLDDKLTMLREQTRRLGFPTHDGVHNGPCHVHKEHAHTIGPDGSLYACPGFTGQLALSTGHIDGRQDSWRESARERFLRLSPWKECGDCPYIPVCAGGCVAASHGQLGDMNVPTCHKHSLDSAIVSLAHAVAGQC